MKSILGIQRDRKNNRYPINRCTEEQQLSIDVSDKGNGKQFLIWVVPIALAIFVLSTVGGWFWVWSYFPVLRWYLINGTIAFGLVGIYPLTYLAYLSFSSETQRGLLETDFRLLGLVSEEELSHTVKELYDTVYNHTQFIIYISLIVVQSLLIFAGYLNHGKLGLISATTMSLIFYSYLGASIFSTQQVVRRYSTFDLQPQVYSAISVRIFMSTVIVFVGTSIIVLSGGQLATTASSTMELTTPEPQAWAAILAFVIGVFPDRGVRWFIQMTNRVLNTETDRKDTYPIRNLMGISAWHEARLAEMGIDNAQNLATVDIRKLLLTTQFDVQEIIHWIDQAILYVKVGQKIDRFREAKISTFHELRLALRDLSLQNPLVKLAEERSGKRSETRQQLATVLGSADPEELDRLANASNFPNYAHIAEYYSRMAKVARRRANLGMEILIGIIQDTNFERAIENAELLLLQSPNDPKVLTNLGVAYYGLAQREKNQDPDLYQRAMNRAYSAYTCAIKQDRQMTKAYYNRSLIYIDRGEYENALQDCSRAIEVDQRHALAFNNRGLAYMHMGYLDLAIKDFDQALKLNKCLANAYYNRGYAHSELGNFGIALRDFEQANQRAYGGNNLFWFRWGETLLKVVNFPEAIDKLSTAILYDQNFAMAYARRGFAYLQRGQDYYRQASYDLQKARNKIIEQSQSQDQIASEDKTLLVEVYIYLGILAGREHQRDVAIGYYQNALELDAGCNQARYNLAKAYESMNRFDDALKEFQLLIEHAPIDSMEARQAHAAIARLNGVNGSVDN